MQHTQLMLQGGPPKSSAMNLTPDSTVFCLLSFEGPDRYAQAGGLGVRITHLAETLARHGFETHLLFVGDPALPGGEEREDGFLTLHRWCQWISRFHPAGVYDGEEGKLADFLGSAPPFILSEIILPALATGRTPIILAEEWHTAAAVIRLNEMLRACGLARRCVILWNANNTMSFHRVDWPALDRSAQITTVSRYMRYLMWDLGVNPLVIPNGIPEELLKPVDRRRVTSLRRVLDSQDDSVFLFKVGRFDPAKCWLTAVDTATMLKASGQRVVFPLRGGIEPHGAEVLGRAAARGLRIADVNGQPENWPQLLESLRTAGPADIYNLRFVMSQEMLRPFYAGADAVLANSGHEPFGLVGLETMAAGGCVFTGNTGEEYAFGGQGAIPLDTSAPEEIVTQILRLRSDPDAAATLRQVARRRAATYSWERVINILLEKIAFVMRLNGVVQTDYRGRRRKSNTAPGRLRPVSPAEPVSAASAAG